MKQVRVIDSPSSARLAANLLALKNFKDVLLNYANRHVSSEVLHV